MNLLEQKILVEINFHLQEAKDKILEWKKNAGQEQKLSPELIQAFSQVQQANNWVEALSATCNNWQSLVAIKETFLQ